MYTEINCTNLMINDTLQKIKITRKVLLNLNWSFQILLFLFPPSASSPSLYRDLILCMIMRKNLELINKDTTYLFTIIFFSQTLLIQCSTRQISILEIRPDKRRLIWHFYSSNIIKVWALKVSKKRLRIFFYSLHEKILGSTSS